MHFGSLKSQCKENNKTKNLHSEYLTSLPPLLARLVFKASLRMYDVKDNFKIKYGFDLNCPFCRKEAETLQHILRCDCVPFVKHKTGILVSRVQQRHNTGSYKKWGKFLKFYDIMRNALRLSLAREGGKLTDNYVLNIYVIMFYLFFLYNIFTRIVFLLLEFLSLFFKKASLHLTFMWKCNPVYLVLYENK